MRKVIISKDLKFDFEDLMRDVDLDHEFTLRDVLRSVVISKIPMRTLQKILQCNYLADYYIEAESKKFNNDGDIEYLRLKLIIGDGDDDGEICRYKEWHFDGVGKEGKIGEEIKKYIPLKQRATYREHYALELSPMWNLANLKIKIDNNVYIVGKKECTTHPPITLIELLFSIFYELSFCGSIEKRNKMTKELEERVKKIKEGKVGKTISIEEIKKKFRIR